MHHARTLPAHGQATKAIDPALSAFLGRAGTAIQGALKPVLTNLWTEGWVLGQQSARALTGVTKAQADLQAAVDWAGWTPGDAAAAEQIAGPGLRQLLAEQGIRIKSISDSRLEELSKVLEDTLRSNEITREPTGPLPPFLSVGDLAGRLKSVLDNPDRAELVAQAEIGRAQATAARQVYAETGRTMEDISTAEDDHVCPVCDAAEKSNPHPLGSVNVPLHPRCRCVPLPVLDEDEDEEEPQEQPKPEPKPEPEQPKAEPKPEPPPKAPEPEPQDDDKAFGGSHVASILGGLLEHDGSATADQHLADLDNVPDGFLEALKEARIKVRLTVKSVGGADSSLHGQQPRGYPAGSTWNDVAGVYMPGSKTAILGNTAPHGSSSLALHEGAHAIDHALGHASLEPAFGKVYDAFAKAAGAWLSPYYRQINRQGSLQEFFGETLAAWMKNLKAAPAARQAAMVRAVAGKAENTGQLADAAVTLDTYYTELLEDAGGSEAQ